MEEGDVVDRRRIVTCLASGATAALYLAQPVDDPRPEAAVALKVLHEHRARVPGFIEMFADEAALSGRLDHPNITRVLGHGVSDGRPYLVIEYVHGVTLGELLSALGRAGRRLVPELAAWIGLEIAAGVAAAHACRGADGELLDVIHRDLKPSNVMLGVGGHVKVIDFGIAKAEGRIHETKEGVVKGTPRYSAPEQSAGHHVDRRADIFSLGVVLWEMLAMRRLVWRNDQAPSIRQFVDEVPEALDAAVQAALAWDPAQRPDSLEELSHSIAESLDLDAVLTAPAAQLASVLETVVPELLEERDARIPAAISRRFTKNSAPPAADGVPLTVRTINVVFSGESSGSREAKTLPSGQVAAQTARREAPLDSGRGSLVPHETSLDEASHAVSRRAYALLGVAALVLTAAGFAIARALLA